ncbi:MAG: hypothetical protein AAFY78_08975, partial [Cyanobacteria bacterium J06648_16]
MKRVKHLVLAALSLVLVTVWNLPLAVQAQDSRLATFIQADGLYRSGNVAAAEQLYRQVKPAFSTPSTATVPEPIYDA